MCRAVLPHLRAQDYGKIINLSGGGATAPLPRISAYAASQGRRRALHRDAGRGAAATLSIDVNAIAPGRAEHAAARRGAGGRAGEASGRRSTSARSSSATRAARRCEKGAALAAFLASASSDGITGRLLSAVWDDWAESARAREPNLAESDIYTLRRIVPEDRGRTMAMRVAIVGCGLIGQKRAQALAPTSRLVAVADIRSPARAAPGRRSIPAATPSRTGACVAARPTSMSSSSRRPTTRSPPITAGRRSRPGKHVLVEKPAARNADGAAARRRRRRERRRRACKVGFNHRFHPAFQQGARSGRCGRARPADVHSRPLRPRRPARLRPRMAGRSRRSPAAANCSTRAFI